MAKKNADRFSLAVQYACNDPALPSRPQIRRWARAASETPMQVTVRFVDAEEGQTLNREFRGKDYATNVLSFHYETDPVVGDLVLCVPVVLRESREQYKPAAVHFAHMIVHGMLHLQGYDHEAGKREAERMEVKEREILARFGIADPY
ncbi:MAG: rRNA maturation RNase YbeY [Georgfuchsia sp.]